MSRHFSDLDSVFEFDALNDLWQLVLTFQSPPCFRGGVDKLEDHEFGGILRERPLVRTVRCRTVANTLSIGLAVLR